MIINLRYYSFNHIFGIFKENSALKGTVFRSLVELCSKEG